MFKSIKHGILVIYGIAFFATLSLSAIFPITAAISVVFSAAGKESASIIWILKVSGAALIFHLLWWLTAVFFSIIHSLIIKPNMTYAAVAGIIYTLISILSITSCVLLYKTGLIPS